MYIDIHIYRHTYKHIYIYIHTHTYTYTYTYIHTHTYTYKHAVDPISDIYNVRTSFEIVIQNVREFSKGLKIVIYNIAVVSSFSFGFHQMRR